MGFKGKIAIPDGTDSPPSVPAAALETATSIFTRIVNYYATTAERNTETAVPSKMSAAEKLGMLCWVDDRKGHCYWDGTVWEWLSVHRKLEIVLRATAAQANGATPVAIVDSGVIVLPPGQRRIFITCSSVVSTPAVPATYATVPRAFVTGPGLSDGQNWAQTYIPTSAGPSIDATVSRSWHVVASGTVQWFMQGLNGTAVTGQIVEFNSSRLEVFDLGPSDD